MMVAARDVDRRLFIFLSRDEGAEDLREIGRVTSFQLLHQIF